MEEASSTGQHHQQPHIEDLHSAPTSASPPPPSTRPRRYFRIGQHIGRPRRYPWWGRCAFGTCLLSCLLLSLLGLAALMFYIIVHPRAPMLEMDDVTINSMVLTSSNSSSLFSVPVDYVYDSTLDLRLLFTIDAYNPNRRVTVQYTKFRIDVSYQGLRLASGYVAPFALGHKEQQYVLAETVSTGIGLQHFVASQFSLDMSLDSVPLAVDLIARTKLKVLKSVMPTYLVHMTCKVGLSPPTGPTGPKLLYKSCKYSKPSTKV